VADSEDADDAVKQFRFKQSVLKTLMNPMNQMLLRSVLVVCGRVRQHQAAFIRDAGYASKSLDYLRFWVDADRWLARMALSNAPPPIHRCFKFV
jgi:hypothetical protein